MTREAIQTAHFEIASLLILVTASTDNRGDFYKAYNSVKIDL